MKILSSHSVCCGCCLPTPLTRVSGGGGSDDPACGPPVSLSLHLASSSITSGGSAQKSSGDDMERMWLQLKRWCVCRVCGCYRGGIEVMDVFGVDFV